MKEKIEINRAEDFKEPVQKKQVKKPKRSKAKYAGIYLGIVLIVSGLIWYAVNLGLIPINLIIEQAGPILVVILGILILIKSL